MSLPPKLWGGPTAVGEATSRGNDISGAEYQTRLSPRTRAVKKGDFHEVYIEPEDPPPDYVPVLFASGLRNGGGTLSFRESPGFKAQFFGSRVITQIPLGNNNSVASGYTESNDTYRFYYPVDHRVGVETNIFVNFWSGDLYLSWAYKRRYSVEEWNVGPYVTAMFTAPSGTPTELRPAVVPRGATVPLGRLNKASEPRMLLVSPADTELTDVFDLPINRPQLKLIRGQRGEPPIVGSVAQLPYPTDRAPADFDLLEQFAVTPTEIVIIALEYPPSRRGALSSHSDPTAYQRLWYTPEGEFSAGVVSYLASEGRVWMFRSTTSGATWEATRITAFEARVNCPQIHATETLSADQPLFGFPYYSMATHEDTGDVPYLISYPKAGGVTVLPHRRMNRLMATGSIIVLSRTRWVLLFSMPDGREYGGVVVDYRSFILRTEDSGATWSFVSSPLTNQPGDAPMDKNYTFFGTALREGVALVKCVEGMTGLSRAVKFLRTVDYGETWVEVVPTGLPEVISDKLGTFEVLEVKDADGPAPETLVAMPCWEARETGGAYVTFLSTDDGSTWKRGRTIATSTQFRRVDYDLVENETSVEADNFGTLDYRGTLRKPAPLDVALPWRYDGEIEPPPT